MLNLPTLCNINPRSLYNKLNEFHTFVEQEELDCIFISESWERVDLPLKEVIKLKDFEVISNAFQRPNIGGRPAILVNRSKFDAQNLTNTVIHIPWGVEAVWCVITPKNVSQSCQVQKIACCALYSKPDSRKKTLLLDHVSDAFHILNRKYGRGLEFCIAGDTNDLDLDPILNLNHKFQQIVNDFTRMNPPAILDPVITTMGKHYQVPLVLDPLDADLYTNGVASDHRIVVVRQLRPLSSKSARQSRIVKCRPLPETGLNSMKIWFQEQTWSEIFEAESAHVKAEILQNKLLSALDRFCPEKSIKFNNDDQPWMSRKLKFLDRKRKRIYRRERKSEKWKDLNKSFKDAVKLAKKDFYKKKIADLKEKKPGQWYSWLKRVSSHDQRNECLKIDEISHLSTEEQAELIADKFSSIPNEYDELKTSDISIPPFSCQDILEFSPTQVWLIMSSLKTNKATVDGDIPAKIIKRFAAFLADPLCDIINTGIRRGEYPNIYKKEISTPVPKKFPPKNISEVRNISGLFVFDKIAEKLITEVMIADMKDSFDKSQYGNQPGISIQHYLVNMLHKILTAVDINTKSEAYAVIASLIDWKDAFPRQDPRMGIESFIKMGVRPSLIPILINYYQGREMCVKWNGVKSSQRHLKGGGPQGATLGLLGYSCQSNDNADMVEEDCRFKFVDDLSLLEVLNILLVGLSSYNIKVQVPNDINIHNQFIPPENLKTQSWLNGISQWTEEKKMLINAEKTKAMVFNFTDNHQFSTRLSINSTPIETIQKTKLLGTVITDDLKWDENTRVLVQKANMKMTLLQKAASFGASIEDLKQIYIAFIRSQLEQSCVVWSSSLTEKNCSDLERVQKSAIKIILGQQYKSYETALKELGMESLEKRREKLSLKFARKCVANEKTKHMFPLNNKAHQMKTRGKETFKVQFAKTDRLKKSPIIYMQRLLNEHSQS